jgi:tetratricopeptide (TPR) repeat protein
MSAAIGDKAAIAFAASFYQALGFGRSIQTSFRLGCNQIDLVRLGEANTPVLLTRKGAEPAEEFLLKHLKNIPPVDCDPLEKAGQLDTTGKTVEAIHLLEATAKNESGRSLIHYNLGVLYQKLGRHDEAVSQYRRATELEDPTGDAHYNLGLLYNEANLLKEAVQELTLAVKINPNHTEAMKALGILEDQSGDSSSAILWFQKALKIHPQDAQALNGLAESLRNIGQANKALDKIKQARKLEPFNRTFQITEQEIEKYLKGGER